jgi:hypothetical protein
MGIRSCLPHQRTLRRLYDTYIKYLRIANSLGIGDLTASITIRGRRKMLDQGSSELQC